VPFKKAESGRIFISFFVQGLSSAVSVIVPAPQDATQGAPLEPDLICGCASWDMTILASDGLFFHSSQHLTLKTKMICYRDRL
jgi:hypothetical protein